MHPNNGHKTEVRKQKTDERRCQALTRKGRQCRKKAEVYRIYEEDRLEYLCCKPHFQFFMPHPSQKGQQPPEEG